MSTPSDHPVCDAVRALSRARGLAWQQAGVLDSETTRRLGWIGEHLVIARTVRTDRTDRTAVMAESRAASAGIVPVRVGEPGFDEVIAAGPALATPRAAPASTWGWRRSRTWASSIPGVPAAGGGEAGDLPPRWSGFGDLTGDVRAADVTIATT